MFVIKVYNKFFACVNHFLIKFLITTVYFYRHGFDQSLFSISMFMMKLIF